MKKLITIFTMLMLGMLNINTAFAYDKVFISYFAPENMSMLTQFIHEHKLGGMIMWEMKGDATFDSGKSLLAAAKQNFQRLSDTPPKVMAYWTDWGIYAYDSYPIDGSLNAQGQTVANPELKKSLAGINILAYAFLEAKTAGNKDDGTLYFVDPWADLNLSNMSAFAKLQNCDQYYGKLSKIISVGGAGHDDTFSKIIGTDYVANFVNSAKTIIADYHLDGIDLDYENFYMTPAESEHYAELVKQLRQALPDKLITVTIPADPDFIHGKREGRYGYSMNAFNVIAANADYINLMTYDFHGSWDSRSGLLTNIKQVGTDPLSVTSAVTALEEQGIKGPKIMVGAPAYGRAVTVADPGSDNTGFLQTITGTITGDTGGASMFQYKYIVAKMLGHGLTQTLWDNYGGVSAFGSYSPSSLTKHALQLTNTGTKENGDLAFGVTITNAKGVFPQQGYIYPQNTPQQPSYLIYPADTATLQAIQGQHDLKIEYETYKGKQTCPGDFDFDPAGVKADATANILIRIGSDGKGICEVKWW